MAVLFHFQAVRIHEDDKNFPFTGDLFIIGASYEST